MNPKENDDSTPAPAPYVVAGAAGHTMLESLTSYVQQKIHQDIRSRTWSEIVVRGSYSRHPPARQADCEKQLKKFNFHRPTTTKLGPNTIAVNCFPGLDYTNHYASLVASYLALSGQDPAVVRCIPPPPSQCIQLLLTSNLQAMGPVDIVVFGYGYRLNATRGKEWEGSASEDDLFSWQKKTLPNGTVVAYLGCLVSIWGDISYHLLHALHQLSRIKSLLYLGKAGSLRPEVDSNEGLVTGHGSYVNGDFVTWESLVGPECSKSPRIKDGDIVTVSSPLCESLDWLAEWKPKASWVDCEVGCLAQACKEVGVKFGYLHIISDNVASNSEENLANEDVQLVRDKRQALFDEVELILEAFFARVGQ